MLVEGDEDPLRDRSILARVAQEDSTGLNVAIGIASRCARRRLYRLHGLSSKVNSELFDELACGERKASHVATRSLQERNEGAVSGRGVHQPIHLRRTGAEAR